MKLPEELISDVSVVVPAGYGNSAPPDRTDWFSCFWYTALSKVEECAIPALVGINLHRFRISSSGPPSFDSVKSTPIYKDNDKLPTNIELPKGVVAAGTTGGAALGAVIGMALAIEGGPAGMAIGAVVGAGVGGRAGGTASTGFAIVVHAVRKYVEKVKQK